MIVADPKFRPNPSRAIYVDGPINEEMVSRLTPQMLQFLSESRDPITIYIVSSPGGLVVNMEAILRLLKSSDQDASPPCSLITVVTNKAASAAADLLASGDYAIAFPDSMILYHGLRTPFRETMTAETTSLLAHYLRLSNDAYAMDLARKVEMRFLFRFLVVRAEFADYRAKQTTKNLQDLDCFLAIIRQKLSRKAQEVFDRAKDRYGRYEALLVNLVKKSERTTGPKRLAQMEANRIKAIIDFEVAANKKNPNWTFRDGGLPRLGDDFFLLNEYLESQQNDRFKIWCRRIGQFALSDADAAEIKQISDEKARDEKTIEKVQPLLQPIWSFFVALCHALQEGENELTAADAYWLGLVDEVMGIPQPTTRWIEENQPDPPPAPVPEQLPPGREMNEG